MEPILPPDPQGFIRDDRDPTSKVSRYLGDLSYNCNFGISVYDSGVGASDRVQRLERDLRAAFQPLPLSPTVLHKYSIFQNKAYFATLPQKNGGLIGGIVYSMTMPPGEGQRPKCEKEKMAGGWFAPADLSNDHSPITIDIDITFAGTKYSITSAYSPSIELVQEAGFWAGGIDSVLSQPEWIVAVQEAMAKANARLIETIRAASRSAEAASSQ